MRKLYSTIILGLLTLALSAQKTLPKPATQPAPASQPVSSTSGYQVTLQTPSYREGIIYLCYHMGKNLNIADSTVVTPAGKALFKGAAPLPPGIYAIVFPGKRLTFDFFIDKEQQIDIYADSANLQNVVVTGSSENPLFQQYQQRVSILGGRLQQERNAYNMSTTKSDSLLHQKNFEVFNKELTDYRDSIMKNKSQSMMAACLNAMKEPEILIKSPKTRQDSLDNYNYYKAHYWDGVSFMDARIIRTPFFLPKLERYYREVVVQAPDSIIKDIDYRLLYARNAPEMYKFLLNWLTDEYINPKIMGQDAVFVHLFEKYHSKGETPWLNEKQHETISRRAYMQMSNLIGVKASNLEMVDSTGKMKALYDQPGEYTLVVFWDPTCGHCKEEIPRIDSIYKASWKAHGVKIYSVLSDNEKKKEWVNYLKEHKLGEWINVYETKEMEKLVADAQKPSFRQLYDVIQTPTILLLDKDKRIVGKKLGITQLNDFLKTKWEKKG